MGLEYQLNKMSKENAGSREILDRVKAGIEQLRGQGLVGPSFSFATITQEGYQSLNP
jgi:hypothetical protein